MISISKYMEANLVALLNVQSRNEALHALVDVLYAGGKLPDRNQFYEAIMDREKIVSTGIGMGVAIPHAKLPSFRHFFIAIGILQKGVDWNALDQAPVRLIFMIGGPEDKQTEYLQILSSLTLAIKDEELRKKILVSIKDEDLQKKVLTLNSQQAIIGLFTQGDERYGSQN